MKKIYTILLNGLNILPEYANIYLVQYCHKKSNTIRCWTFCIDGGFEQFNATIRWTITVAVAFSQKMNPSSKILQLVCCQG